MKLPRLILVIALVATLGGTAQAATFHTSYHFRTPQSYHPINKIRPNLLVHASRSQVRAHPVRLRPGPSPAASRFR